MSADGSGNTEPPVSRNKRARPALAAQGAVGTGIAMAITAVVLYSTNDMVAKRLTEVFALHQMILFRSITALLVLSLFLALSPRGFSQLRTRMPGTHLFRVCLILMSNAAFFTALASMPIADAAAVAYSSPLVVTALSVAMLGERVGPRRWAAVALGMTGVLLMVRPGAETLQPGAILALASAALYAISNLMIRRMGGSETALTLAFYSHGGFLLLSIVMGLWVGDGHLATDHPLWGTLFRAWIWPPAETWAWFVAGGLCVSVAGVLMTQAYRTTPAAVIAPFDYIGMPMAILWGVLVFGTWPDVWSWAGIVLICGSGLYILWRETQLQKKEQA